MSSHAMGTTTSKYWLYTIWQDTKSIGLNWDKAMQAATEAMWA